MGSRQFNRLLDVVGSPEQILAGSVASLLRAGIKRDLACAISQCRKGSFARRLAKQASKNLAWSRQPAQAIITRECADYPKLLASIPDAPPLLYLKGNHDYLHRPQLAIVGSRNPTAGGRRNAREFARELSQAGITVTSGLAMGIDVESHLGALGHSGSTVAVLGTGMDQVYPARHAAVFDQIAGQGLLVSEFPLGTPPARMNFPRRNRIISGLAAGVLVVEAGLKSGSMITARYALEQGREVFAIPGSIHNPVARGCHKLISEGARLVEKAQDITEECGSILATFLPVNAEQQMTPPLSGAQKVVLGAIGFDTVMTDKLIAETGLACDVVAAALTELELLGLIRREKGGVILATA